MTLRHLVWRTLRHYRGASLAVIAGLAVATAVITGSLVIGSSLRGSLFELSLNRLGAVNHAAMLQRPISDRVVTGTAIQPLLQTSGTASPAEGEPTPIGVTVWGVDAAFATMQGLPQIPSDGLLVNAALARDLKLRAGNDVVLGLNRPRAIGMDSLFARRKLAEVMATMQLPIAAILPDNGPGDFRLDGQSGRPRNAFIAREALARSLSMAGKANVLVAPVQRGDSSDLTAAIAPRLALADHGLHLRVKPRTVSLTSDAFTLTYDQARAATAAAFALQAHPDWCSVYLAITIRAPNSRQIAYAIVAGNTNAERLGLPRQWGDNAGEIALNTWAAQDLQAKPGDVLTLEYLVASPDGSFPRKTLQARLVGTVPMAGPTADAHLMPEYEGLTDAVTMGDWKPPFPVDMKRVTPRDEQYWEKYQTIPKAFLPEHVVGRMWGETQQHETSIEVTPPPGQAPAAFAPAFEAQLLAELAKRQPLAPFRNTAQLALDASTGTTDFGQLFLALSMFIIAAGAGLAAMLVRLGLERRTKQIGLLLALGITPPRVRQLLLAEGMVLNAGGVLLGLPLGLLYAAGLLKAMTVFWTAAIGDAPALWLRAQPADLLYCVLGGLAVGGLTIVLSLRGLGTLEPMALWQTGLGTVPRGRGRPMILLIVALVLGAGALMALPRTFAFFTAGFMLLVAGLAAISVALRPPSQSAGLRSLRGLAWRNASQNPRRSLLVCGLIAAATFVIIATAASTRDLGRTDTFDRAGPSGGFNLQAVATVPLPYDPATPAGRRNLGFPAEAETLLGRCTVASYRQSPGDDLSCANAAKASTPRLLAYTGEGRVPMGRFERVQLPMGFLPRWSDPVAMTDRDTLEWRLHLKPNAFWKTQDAFGRPLELIAVAGFSHSIFAGQLIVSNHTFNSAYRAVTMPSFFLIETPKQDEQAVVAALRATVGDVGLQVRPTREVLAEYAAGENVYISMFLALGALGLLLGTVGMAVVTARNIVERRAELALLTATGFSRQQLVRLLLWEHGGLLVLGLVLGTVAALVAMVPQLASPESSVNWPGLGLAVGAVLLVGLGANVLAIRRSLDDDLVGALRHE